MCVPSIAPRTAGNPAFSSNFLAISCLLCSLAGQRMNLSVKLTSAETTLSLHFTTVESATSITSETRCKCPWWPKYRNAISTVFF